MKSNGIQSRLSHSQWTLKPQDLAVALKLVCLNGLTVPYAGLAKSMHLSVFEAHSCVARLTNARLVATTDGVHKVILPIFGPFLQFGAPYMFPAIRGEVTVGFPTAHAVSPLREQLRVSDDLPPVWPHADGPKRGNSLLALYPNLPLAANQDSKLYELLALFDALRIGQAREREIVNKVLAKLLTKTDG